MFWWSCLRSETDELQLSTIIIFWLIVNKDFIDWLLKNLSFDTFQLPLTYMFVWSNGLGMINKVQRITGNYIVVSHITKETEIACY